MIRVSYRGPTECWYRSLNIDGARLNQSKCVPCINCGIFRKLEIDELSLTRNGLKLLGLQFELLMSKERWSDE